MFNGCSFSLKYQCCGIHCIYNDNNIEQMVYTDVRWTNITFLGSSFLVCPMSWTIVLGHILCMLSYFIQEIWLSFI